MKTSLFAKTLVAAGVAAVLSASSSVFAQVKIGSSPTTIATNVNLDVQSTDGNRAVVLKDNGFVGIGTVTPAHILTLGPSLGSSVSAVTGKKMAVYQNAAGDDFYGIGISAGVLQFHAASLPTEAPGMVLTGTGNVGINTTAPGFRLDVLETATPTFGSSVVRIQRPGNKFMLFEPTATFSSGTTGNPYNGVVNGGDGHLIFSTDGDPAVEANNGFVIAPWSSGHTTGLKIMENGNVGIATAAPPARLSVFGGAAYFGIDPAPNITNMVLGTSTSDGVIFQNQNGAASDGAIVIQRSGSSAYSPLYLSRNAALGSGPGYLTAYQVSGTLVGSISTNGTSTAFNTTSDVRLKENIKATHYGLSDLMKIRVADYNYKSDEAKKRTTGFIAQELYKIFPEAVTVGGDDVKENPWVVDYSKVTPLLVKAIQDQQAQIEALKAANAQLTGQVSELNSLKAEVASIKALLQVNKEVTQKVVTK